MSFITKRERVFNEYDLFDLPARNEGKLKAYASCTDARAWSHFCSDKTEHLVEIIKKNNDTCRPKYVPTDVIVETLMVAKNAEIARLRRKIGEFEQMLAAYDQLELTCDQKCEIANAHAAIKAANKELDELCLDLDISGFTEVVDSEAFETGKSRGDEPARYLIDETPKSKDEEWSFEKETTPRVETKSNQMGLSCPCDASTSATDPRIEEMQETIITKDAKLGAMQNTIAVMENDVCEPYCIYAHIYTALEKIFGILCQNDKYKQYLDLLTAGKDTRCIDIKGKILFKLKVIEKFCLALIAPCSQDFGPSPQDCSCFRAEIVAHVESTFALTSAESKMPSLDNKRAQLVADIMENVEMKEILSKESTSIKEDDRTQDSFDADSDSIDAENIIRLKNLQENYDDLMTCYENLKQEKDSLQVKCHKYEGLEKELESLRNQLSEYNSLWNEKEHYKKRSANLDTLKEQYLVLSHETSNLETKLKVEAEINSIKCKSIDDLRSENILLERKLNEITIVFEREKNTLQCKLQETECKVMCQEQQIKSLSVQIDRFLEQDPEKAHSNEPATNTIALIDEIESLKEQIKNIKDALFCNEEEKLNLQEEFQDKLNIINDLKMEIEDWKSTYEKTLQRNDYLEKYTESFRDEVNRLIEENRILSQDVREKTTAVENLINVINNKSQEVNNLLVTIDQESSVNKDLLKQLQELRENYNSSITSLHGENEHAMKLLEHARQENQELLEKVKNYDDMVHKQNDMFKTLESQTEDYNELKKNLLNTIEENKNLQLHLNSRENNNSILLQEIQRLREVNNFAVNNINRLQDVTNEYEMSLELAKKESEILEGKLLDFETTNEELQGERNTLKNELRDKTYLLDTAINSIQLTKKESYELMDKLQQLESLKEDFNKLNEAYHKLIIEKHMLQKDLAGKKKDVEMHLQCLGDLKIQNEHLSQKSQQVTVLEKQLTDLETAYDQLLTEKNSLQGDFDNKTEEYNNLCNTLENKIEENKELRHEIKSLEVYQLTATKNIKALQNENLTAQTTLNAIKKESAELIDKIKHYEGLENEFDKLKNAHNQVELEKEKLQNELAKQLADLKRMEQENHEIYSESQTLLSCNEDLERILIKTRTERMSNSGMESSLQEPYANVIKEINIMKKEKNQSQNKIRDLFDRLEESENIISNLSEQVLARDDKISILENHINELEDEVKRLHSCLAEVVDTGEEIKDYSYQQIDQSIKKMEAHHSKATHNIKMEVAILQNENAKLEKQLSVTKLKTEDISRDKHKYISQIIHLQNEREIIITDIKQLELKSVGDSVLSPDKCDVEDVLNSLDRIGKCLNARSSKSTSLEQAVLKLQTSSQLLQSKADEAKRIVEREKLKINEKEEAIKERFNVEKELLVDLKETLEKQISRDKDIIRDLESEILNKDLIIDKINKSTQNYISKLEEDMQSLQELYQNSIGKVDELQDKIQKMSEEKRKDLELVENTNKILCEKSKDIAVLQKNLEILKKKPNRNLGVQTLILETKRDIESQTDNELQYDEYEGSVLHDKDDKNTLKVKDEYIKLPQEKTAHELLENKPRSANEVQVLTANVEPTFDYVKYSYLNYKIQRLSHGRLEQYSVSCLSDQTDIRDSPTLSGLSGELFSQYPDRTHKSGNTYADTSAIHPNLIDIYNIQSMHTNSSKIIGNEEVEIAVGLDRPDPESQTKSSAYTSFGLSNDSFETESNLNNNKYRNTNVFDGSMSEKFTDKDLFVIYKDSESNYVPNTSDDKTSWAVKGPSDILVESLTIKHNSIKKENRYNKGKLKDDKQGKKLHTENETFAYLKDGDESVIKKLNINLPRVETQSPSLITTSDGDNKSLDSYTLAIYPSLKQITTSDLKIDNDAKYIKHETPCLPNISNSDKQYVESYAYLDTIFDKNENRLKLEETNKVTRTSKAKTKSKYRSVPVENLNSPFDTESRKKEDSSSRHKLSRVEADVLVIKTKIDHKAENVPVTSGNFGLKYILDTVQREVNPESVSSGIRRTRSDEKLNQAKIHHNNFFSPSILSAFKISSAEYKTVTTVSKGESNNKIYPKTFMDRDVMVKMDVDEAYENKILHLTKTLENIEKDYKMKIEAIKMQYDNHIKSIINEHNHGVKSIQGLHEETLQDIIKVHENEVENLRSMSIEAMQKADKLEKENRTLKTKIQGCSFTCLDEDPIKISTPELKKRKKSRGDTKTLTKTTIEEFNVKPKSRTQGPCTCSLDVNISDTIRNIFEQVDVEQRKMAEHTYMKYIANKLSNGNVETLDAQELSFLHLKVCRTWKMKLTKEEAIQKRINTLENELMNKQRHAQQHIADLDRKVAEERRRLQEVREAVCRNSPTESRAGSPEPNYRCGAPPPLPTAAEKDVFCNCNTGDCSLEIGKRRSAGDLVPTATFSNVRTTRKRTESNRAVLAKLDVEERRERKVYNDELPTRLRKSHDRQALRSHKK